MYQDLSCVAYTMMHVVSFTESNNQFTVVNKKVPKQIIVLYSITSAETPIQG